MSLKPIYTKNAPEALGPYSQAMIVNDLIFTSGQLPINPASGELVDDIEAGTKQSLENIKAILETAGSSMDKIVKVNIFITDMNDFPKINKVYEKYFTEHKPARSCVEVSRLPKDGKIEIEAIALL